MSHIPSSSTNSQGPFSPYQLLPDDAKAEVMKHSSLKQLDQGMSKSDKASNRVALDLIKTVALRVTQVIDMTDELWQDLKKAIDEQASDSKVHVAFKAVIKACGFENVPLMELTAYIRARQGRATHCGISLSDYQKILGALRSTTVTTKSVNYIIEEISRAKGVDFTILVEQLMNENEFLLAFVQKKTLLERLRHPELCSGSAEVLRAYEPSIEESDLERDAT